MEKSLARMAASMAALATATTPSNEYAVVRALSTSTAWPRRAPTTEAATPYTDRISPSRRAKVPRRSTSAATLDVSGVRRLARSGRAVFVAVLDQDGVGVERAVLPVEALHHHALAVPEQRWHAGRVHHRHAGGAVGDDEPHLRPRPLHRSRHHQATQPHPLVVGRPLPQQ